MLTLADWMVSHRQVAAGLPAGHALPLQRGDRCAGLRGAGRLGDAVRDFPASSASSSRWA